MIKEPLYSKITFLKGIAHDLENTEESTLIYLWDREKLEKTLELLLEHGVFLGSVIKAESHFLISI